MATQGNSARYRREVGFVRTHTQHKPYLLQIAETCISIYQIAEACCAQFRGCAVEAEAAGFWNEMSTALRKDLLYARKALRNIRNSVPMEMAENPLALLDQLRVIETKLSAILEASGRLADENGGAACLGYSLQVHLLHPAIDRLRQTAALGLPEPILPEDASSHPGPFLEGFPAHFATGPFTLALLDSIHQLRAQNLTLRSQDTRDPVTGALNRSGILDVITSLFALVERTGHTVAILMVGIDRLDHVHQTQGPLFLNQMLRTLYHTIASVIRKGDWLGRYDFSSFLAFLPHTNHRHLFRTAERMVDAARNTRRPGTDLFVRIGGSFGRIDRSKGRHPGFYIEQAVDCLMRAGNSPRNCILIE